MEESQSLADGFGFYYLEHDNLPLSEKHNALLTASRDISWDYLLLIGSDTLCSPGILDVYKPALESGVDWCGFRDLYFYDHRRLYYFKGYGSSRDDTLGAGRMFSRKTVELADYRLWPREANRGLDWMTAQLLKEKLHQHEHHIRFRTHTPHIVHDEYMVELRSEVNVTKLKYWARTGFREIHPVPEKVQRMLGDFHYPQSRMGRQPK